MEEIERVKSTSLKKNKTKGACGKAELFVAKQQKVYLGERKHNRLGEDKKNALRHEENLPFFLRLRPSPVKRFTYAQILHIKHILKKTQHARIGK